MPFYHVKFSDGHSATISARDKQTAKRIALAEHRDQHEAMGKPQMTAGPATSIVEAGK